MHTSHPAAPLPTPQELDAWLTGHAPDQTVGSRLSMRSCPLACYLSQSTGYIWVVAGDWAGPAEAPGYGTRCALPPWLTAFTACVDGHPEQTLTARAARDYLHEALTIAPPPTGDAP